MALFDISLLTRPVMPFTKPLLKMDFTNLLPSLLTRSCMQANINNNYLVSCSLILLESCLVLEATPSRDFRQILVQKCPSLVKVQCERGKRSVNGRFCP